MAYIQGKSGSFTVSSSNIYVKGTVSWSETYDVSMNKSYVSAALRLYRTNSGYTTEGTGGFSLFIGGEKFSSSGYFAVSENSNTLCVSGGAYIEHLPDGTKGIEISVSGNVYTAELVSPAAASVSLTNISRGSAIASVTSCTANGENACTVSIDRRSTGSFHKVRFYLAQGYEYTKSGVSASCSYIIPKAWCSAVTNGESAEGTVYLSTYQDSACLKKIGDTVSKPFTIFVPSDIVPEISEMTVSVQNGNSTVDLWGIALEGYSKALITGAAESFFGASVIKTEITGGGYTGSALPFESGILKIPGENEFTLCVTDSRGRKKTEKRSITVIDYNAPRAEVSVCERYDGVKGADSPTGNMLHVKASSHFSPCGGHNSPGFLKVYWFVSGGERAESQSAVLEENADAYISAGFLPQSEYTVEFVCADALSSGSVFKKIPISAITLHFKKGGKALGIGKYAQSDNTLAVAWDTDIDGDLNAANAGFDSLTIGETEIKDFAVENGISGGWTYVKFASGRAEAYYTDYSFTFSSGGAWSGTLYLSTNTFSIPGGIFSSAPTAFVSPSDNGWVWLCIGIKCSSATSGQLRCLRNTNSAYVYKGNIFLKGRWKT